MQLVYKFQIMLRKYAYPYKKARIWLLSLEYMKYMDTNKEMATWSVGPPSVGNRKVSTPKYCECDGRLHNEIHGWSFKPTNDSLHNTRLANFPHLFLNVDLWVFSFMKLLHDYLVMCWFNCINARFVCGISIFQKVSCRLNFYFRSLSADSKPFVCISYVNPGKDS